MRAPGSRLSDDLFSLYVAGLAWFLLPIYGNGLAVVLPSDFAGFRRTLDVVAAAIVVVSAWIGYRGGPFLVNRAGVVHELGSPLTLRSLMLTRLIRQGVAYAALAAIAVSVLLAMSDAESFGFAQAARSSFVAMAAMFTSVGQAVGWLVVFKGHERPVGSIVAANLGIDAAVVATVAVGQSFWSPVGVAVLVVSMGVSCGLAVYLLDRVPVDHLWRRASALEDMRSAMLSFDFQQVLVNLRRAVDQTEGRRSSLVLGRSWMPLQLWRYLTSIQHGLYARLGQFVISVVAVGLLLRYADPANGVIALAIAGIGFIVGIELSSPVAATAGQIVFLVHYPKGSVPVLRRQVTTAVVLAMVLGTISIGWDLPGDRTRALAVLGLFAFGTLAASAQGRLGSPDMAQLASILGPSGLGPALWARALLGPILTIGLTIVISHQWLRPDGLNAPWPTFAMMILIATAVVATYPLEKRPT